MVYLVWRSILKCPIPSNRGDNHRPVVVLRFARQIRTSTCVQRGANPSAPPSPRQPATPPPGRSSPGHAAPRRTLATLTKVTATTTTNAPATWSAERTTALILSLSEEARTGLTVAWSHELYLKSRCCCNQNWNTWSPHLEAFISLWNQSLQMHEQVSNFEPMF